MSAAGNFTTVISVKKRSADVFLFIYLFFLFIYLFFFFIGLGVSNYDSLLGLLEM